MSLMTDEEYFDHLRSMFNSQGWKLFIEETQGSVEQLDSIEACRSLEDLWYRKGQIAAMANILNLESMIKRAEEELETKGESL
jgi:hypothetical protein